MKKKQGNSRRTRGSGSLEKRNGAFLARWTVDGKRFSQSLKTTDRREAEKMLKDITAPFRLANDADRLAYFAGKIKGKQDEIEEIKNKIPALALKDAWNVYELSPERPYRSKAMIDFSLRMWNKFEAFMLKTFPDVVEFRQIGREHAIAFMAFWGRSHSSATYNRMRNILKAVWDFMADYPAAKVEGKNPFSRIARKPETNVRRRSLNADELRRLCAFVEGDYRLLFAVGIYTGLRLGDAALLKWENIDMTRHIIICTPRKTLQYDTVVNIPIHDTLYMMLCEIPESKMRGYIMPEAAKEYKSKFILTRLRGIFKACGIDTTIESPDNGRRRRCIVGFHSLRHSFVSMAANGGAPLAVVQKLVGHTTAKMTAHYFHESHAALNAAVALLPDVIGDCASRGESEMQPKADSGAYAAFEKVAGQMTAGEIERAILHLRRLSDGYRMCVDVVD